jgi:valyl-tRNA synthetase
MGTKHGLEFINIFTDDGRLNENAGPFQGQKRFDVRFKIQDALKQKGLLGEKKDVSCEFACGGGGSGDQVPC